MESLPNEIHRVIKRYLPVSEARRYGQVIRGQHYLFPYELRRFYKYKTPSDVIKAGDLSGFIYLISRTPALIHNVDIINQLSRYGRIKMLQYILERGTNADLTQALMTAVVRNNLRVVRLLRAYGANITAADNMALFLAIEHGYLVLIAYLINHGADINVEGGLSSAIENNHEAVVHYLVGRGAQITDELALAAGLGNLSLVKFLFTNGGQNYLNEAALRATRQGHLDVVKYLISKGANPIDLLITSLYHYQVFRYLIGLGIKYDADELLRLAAETGSLEVVKYLMPQVLHNIEPAFEAACSAGHLHIVKYLSPYITKSSYALLTAIMYERYEILDYLLSHFTYHENIINEVLAEARSWDDQEMFNYLIRRLRP